MPDLGAFGVVRTNGWAARGIRWVTRSDVNHAFVHVGDGQIIEARPSGAGYNHVESYPGALWSTLPDKAAGAKVAAAAVSLIGTPYSWVDCAAIGLADTFGWHVPRVVRARLARADRMMCSQLVDEAYRRAGIELFSDGRIPGDVAPNDLERLIGAKP